MAELNFPDNPTTGQVFDRWVYDEIPLTGFGRWVLAGGSATASGLAVMVATSLTVTPPKAASLTSGVVFGWGTSASGFDTTDADIFARIPPGVNPETRIRILQPGVYQYQLTYNYTAIGTSPMAWQKYMLLNLKNVLIDAPIAANLGGSNVTTSEQLVASKGAVTYRSSALTIDAGRDIYIAAADSDTANATTWSIPVYIQVSKIR